MAALRQYILGIVSAALICSIVSSAVKNTFAVEIIKLVCGLFLVCALMGPIHQIDFASLLDASVSYSDHAQAAAEEGRNMAAETMAQRIKEEAQAYILDKAAAIDAEVSAEITLDQACIPVHAVLHGSLSPHQRSVLESILESELGIAKENQQWTG